jgi:membrane-associated protein
MSLLTQLDFGKALSGATQNYGPLVYAILFALFLFQTGFLIGPAVPGNPLLFAAGLLANPKNGTLNIALLIVVLSAAVFAGNVINYYQGIAAGPQFKKRERWRGNIERAEAFFERHGSRTVAIATFVPFIRAFVPFVAGMGRMDLRRYLASSLIGAIAWITVWCLAGYYLGQIPGVAANLNKIVIGIIALVSVVAIVKTIQLRKKGRATLE